MFGGGGQLEPRRVTGDKNWEKLSYSLSPGPLEQNLGYYLLIIGRRPSPPWKTSSVFPIPFKQFRAEELNHWFRKVWSIHQCVHLRHSEADKGTAFSIKGILPSDFSIFAREKSRTPPKSHQESSLALKGFEIRLINYDRSTPLDSNTVAKEEQGYTGGEVRRNCLCKLVKNVPIASPTKGGTALPACV